MTEAGQRSRSGLPVGDLLTTGPVTVDLPVPETALAIGAHPDDIEFGAGATLARWAEAGCRIVHLVLTDGSKGSWDPNTDLADLVAARQAECRTAARVLHGDSAERPDDVIFLGRIDGELTDDEATRRDVVRVIREIRPNAILGHDPWRRYRLHPDHRAAGFVTLGAVVAARDPHFFDDIGPSPHRPSALLLWEPDLANHVERAAGYAQAKVAALLCHHSQLESTMGIDGEPPEPTEEQGASQSALSGAEEFAEQVAWQLEQHGRLAGQGPGEAFHLIDHI